MYKKRTFSKKKCEKFWQKKKSVYLCNRKTKRMAP